jgi:hypothetical protein
MGKAISDLILVAEKVCAEIEGWLDVSTATVTAELLNFQAAKNIKGSLLEFGVHKGRYLSLIYGFHDSEERVVGVDAFFERLGVPLLPQWRDHAMGVIKANVEKIWGEVSSLDLLAGLTSQIPFEKLKEYAPDGYRFISIDAGHDAESVLGDLLICSRLLSVDGIIAVDDLFNPLVPGVSEGFFQWALDAGGSASHSAIAFCGNKAFVSKEASHDLYYKFFSDLILGEKYEFMKGARTIHNRNVANNYSPTFFGRPYICLSTR